MPQLNENITEVVPIIQPMKITIVEREGHIVCRVLVVSMPRLSPSHQPNM